MPSFLPRRSRDDDAPCKLCLFHPDSDRWSRTSTESARFRERVDFRLPPVTTSEGFHLALKQNSLPPL